MSRRSSFINIDEWLDHCSDAEPDSMIYEPDYPKDVAQMKTRTKEPEIFELFRDVAEMCTRIGMTTDKIDERLMDIDSCITTYLQMLKQDVTDEYNKLCEYKKQLVQSVQNMLKDLYLPPFEPEDNELDNVKQKRMLKMNELRDKQTKQCSTLGIETPALNFQTGIPTEQELNQLQMAVADLEKEELRRRERYNNCKSAIQKCIIQLEYTSHTSFENNLLNDEPKYTESHLKALSSFQSKLETLYTAQQEKLNKATQKLISLYDRLDISQEERDKFLKTHNICKPSILTEIDAEIERYEILKKQNIKKFIDKIKQELTLEYERCFMHADAQDDFLSLSAIGGDGEGNEQLLDLYERELDLVKAYYESNKEILDRFHKWRNMWKELIDLELKANDPNRFNNRGGQLLLEERKRKTLQKGLPKLEKELLEMNDKYSKANGGKKFQVFKSNLDEFISGCWEELNEAKEEEKRERQRAKMNENALKNRKPVQHQVVVPRKSPASKRAYGPGVTPTPTKTPTMNRKPMSSNTNFSALSLDEAEFESQIITCPTSAKKMR